MDSTSYPLNQISLSEPEIWSETRQKQLIWTFLLLGLMARFVRFFLCFPLWEDECFLCYNFIHRGYAELLQPLIYHQVAPYLFLSVEISLSNLLGFNEYVLRLFPFLCSLAALFLFYHLARRLLKGTPLVMAVAIFAVAYPCIRYAAEAKPYGSDLLVSLVLFTLAVEWWRRPGQLRWLFTLIICIPLAIGLSYPAVFSAGGISLFIGYRLVRDGSRNGWLSWVIYNVVLLTSFACFYFLTVRPQSSAELSWMAYYWQNAFPPLASPAKLPLWLIVTHTSDLVAYPIGGGRGASTLTFLGILAGVFFLLRQRRFSFLLLALAPLSLHLLAASLQRYPYGVHVKYSQYIAPFICMLAGLGLAAMCSWLFHNSVRQRRVLTVWLCLLALVGLGSIIRDMAHPYKTKTDMRARAFARWFWFNSSYDCETVCLKTDLHTDFSPRTFSDLSWSAMYLCNQHIYSPRHRNHLPPDWNKISAKRPLRIVQFKDPRYPYDHAAFQRWLAEQKNKYHLVSQDAFAFPCYGKDERRLLNVDTIEIYKFIPRHPSDTITTAKK